MKHYSFFIILAGLLCAAPATARAEVNVFACTPEWGALAEEIGGSHVNVTTATNAKQDVHHIRAKPSLLSAMRKADLVFCSGASLESGWLPILLKKAGGPDVQQNTIGWLMASDYVEKLEVMDTVDRSMGHVHPEGNPHVHLNPYNILAVADVLAERLYLIDAGNAQSYTQNLGAFKTRWQGLINGWETRAANLAGKNVVVYHNAWAYLLDWLDMDNIASLEPKPGVPPTASHLQSVLATVQAQPSIGILVAPHERSKAADWLAGKSSLPIVNLPFTVGGTPSAATLEGVFEDTIAKLEAAAA
jgi:zinc/manganese transport system substrate-binding protein